MGNWLCFDDSEEQDDAEGEQDKDREADGVSDENGDDDEKSKDGADGTIVTRIQEEFGHAGYKFFDKFPTLADDITEGEAIFLQSTRIVFKKESTALTC